MATEDRAAAAIELSLIGATESKKPLQPGGFAAVEADSAGRRAITYGRSESRVWDLATATLVPVEAVLRLHPDGRRGLRRVSESELSVFDIASGEEESRLDGFRFGVPTFGPGNWLADTIRTEAPADPELPPMQHCRVWDVTSGKIAHTLPSAHLLAAYVPDGRLLLIDGRGQASLWDLAAGAQVSAMKAPSERPIKLRVSADGRTAVTIGRKGTTHVWDLDAGKLAASSTALSTERAGGAWDHFELFADGRHAVLGSRPGAYGDLFIGVLDLAAGTLDLSWTTRDEERAITHLVVSPDAPIVSMLVARAPSAPTMLEIWDVRHKQLLASADARLAKGLCMASGDRVVVAGSGAWSGPHYLRVYQMLETTSGDG